MLDVIVPAFVATSHVTESNSLMVDPQYCMDAVFGEIHKTKFNNHVKTSDTSFSAVRADLMSSNCPTPSRTAYQPAPTLQNLEWVMAYWALDNAAPPMCDKGTYGFVVTNGLVRFADKSE